jgi:hypothetical protein
MPKVVALAVVNKAQPRRPNPVEPGSVQLTHALGAPYGPSADWAGSAWPVGHLQGCPLLVLDDDDGSFQLAQQTPKGLIELDRVVEADVHLAIIGWQAAAAGVAAEPRPSAIQRWQSAEGQIILARGHARLISSGSSQDLGHVTPEILAALLSSGRRINPAGKFKAEVAKQMTKADRERRRKTIAKLQEKLTAAKRAKGAELRRLRAECAMEYRKAFLASRERFEQIVREARAARDAARQDAKAKCTPASEELARLTAEVALLDEQQENERSYQRELRKVDDALASTRRRGPSAAERRSESDDEVRHNIPEELVPLFENVRKTIKASDRMSRTEAFLRYAEENPDEVLQAQMEHAEKKVRKMTRGR